MSTATLDTAPSPTTRSMKRIFSLAMVIGTVIPMVVFLAMYRPYGDAGNGNIENQIIWLIMFFAQGHVGLTFLMYLDRSFHSVIRENRVRFILMPMLLVGVLPISGPKPESSN